MSINIQGYGIHASIILLTGKRHSGKSYFLHHALIPKFPFFILWDYNHEHYIQNVKIAYNLSDMTKIFQSDRKVVYRPLYKTDLEFEHFCRACISLHDFMVIIEEIETFAKKRYMSPSMEFIVNTGRHRGIGLTATCRRPAEVHTRIPSNSDYIFAFHQHMTVDIEYLSGWLGEEAYGLRNIEKYGFMVYSDDAGCIIGKHRI